MYLLLYLLYVFTLFKNIYTKKLNNDNFTNLKHL